MEPLSRQEMFNKLIDEGMMPTLIRRKMGLSMDRWHFLYGEYVKQQELKQLELKKIEEANLSTEAELKVIWERIETICFELRIEKDYEKTYALEKELEDLSIKYSEAQFKKSE